MAAHGPAEPTPAYVWGSFERNTGTWCPFAESARIEAAFDAGLGSIFLSECFNATVHFRRDGEPCYQTTPAVGPKPAGYRSVLRAMPGQRVWLHWWASAAMFRLDCPTTNQPLQGIDVVIPSELPAQGEPARPVWQWCDVAGANASGALEANWHAYSDEDSATIEAAWGARRAQLDLCIGLTEYRIGRFNGSYAMQHNTRTGTERMIRRATTATVAANAAHMRPLGGEVGAAAARAALEAETAARVRGEVCALCTESFDAHPEWPIRRTPCGHFFHATCLQHVFTSADLSQRKCPMCRAPLPREDVSDQPAVAETSTRRDAPVDWRGWHHGTQPREYERNYEHESDWRVDR